MPVLAPETPSVAAAPAEVIEFGMHKNLLLEVIRRQAGTIQKAILEGVSNGIDAQATEVDIALAFDHVTIQDNGTGFADEATVRTCFGQFGTPQSDEERARKKFGWFRIGRGQIFAFGRTHWRSGPFEMATDIERRGIEYSFRKGLTPEPGCVVRIDLYRRLDPRDLLEIRRELARNLRYVAGAVRVNGDLVSTNPATEKWTAVTDEAYFQLRSTESWGGIEFYNQGVFVERVTSDKWALSGIVVSRQRLDVNFARNSILWSCPVYRKIQATLNAESNRRLDRKKALTQDERLNLIARLLTQETTFTDQERAQLFLDASRHGWSVDTIKRLRSNKHWTKAPSGRIAFSFAPPGRRADMILQERSCLVLHDELLDWFEYRGARKDFFEQIRCYELSRIMEYVPFEKIQTHLDPSRWRLLPVEKQTKTQTALLGALTAANWQITSALSARGQSASPRVFRVGVAPASEDAPQVSQGVAAWTDGGTFIAIEQGRLRYTSLYELSALVLTVLHEYLHDGDDSGDHGHDPEFYRGFHDAADLIGQWTRVVHQVYLSRLKAAHKRLPAPVHLLTLHEQNRIEMETALENAGQTLTVPVGSDPQATPTPAGPDPEHLLGCGAPPSAGRRGPDR